MVDVFDEVDQSLREDKKTRLWKRFGPFVWFLCFALIVGVGYNEFSTYQNEQRISKNVERFETALSQLEDGAYSDAQAILSDLIETEAEIAPLAAQYLARSFYEGNGDADGAALVLNAHAMNDTGPMGNVSRLKAIYLKVDDLSLSDLEDELAGLHQQNSALGALALELVAAKALAEGDYARAREEFTYLEFMTNAPEGVRQRAQLAISVLPPPPVIDEDSMDEEAPAGASEGTETANNETASDAEVDAETQSGDPDAPLTQSDDTAPDRNDITETP